MFVRIGLVVVAAALLALLSVGFGLGMGYVQITRQGIAWVKHDKAPQPPANDSNTAPADDALKQNGVAPVDPLQPVSADDLLKQKGVAYVEPQPAAQPPQPPTPEASKPAQPPVAGPKPEDAVSQVQTIRIAAGSTLPLKDSAGNVWEAASGIDGEISDRRNVKVKNSRFPELYQQERWKVTEWTRKVPDGKYIVRLYFAETSEFVGRAGQRTFSIIVPGAGVKNLDVFSEAGGVGRELIKSLNARVTDGTLSIRFIPQSRTLLPFINGIEVIPDGPLDAGVAADDGVKRKFAALRISAGSHAALRDPAGNIWFEATEFEGGKIPERRRPVRMENLDRTDFPELYQGERIGMSAWRKKVPNGNYLVKLHFAETSPDVSRAGQRVFDVVVKDQSVFNLDIFKESGGKNRALVKSFHVTVTDRILAITFHSTGKNVAEINGIEVIPE